MIDAEKTGTFIAQCRRERHWAQKQFLPECNTGNIICRVIAAVLAGILIYLDKNLPDKKYRFSNPWIEGIAGNG